MEGTSHLLGELRREAPAAGVSVQTNGVLLDREWLALFGEHEVSVSVSLDGDRPANDRHRVGHDGFDHWYGSTGGIRVRMFENLLDLCLGGASRTEGLGEGRFSILTVETDGTVQDLDVLKVTREGGAHLPAEMNLRDCSIADILEHPAVRERAALHGVGGLAAVCRRCKLRDRCGGGHLPHRFSDSGGFRNPSIYCADLAYLIRHVRGVVRRDLVVAKADR